MQCPDSHEQPHGRQEVGHTWTCFRKFWAHLTCFAAITPFHFTAQERLILSITPEPWLFLPLIVRLDPGYRNVKGSTNIKLALNSNDFFFPFPFTEGREKKKKKKASFSWPTTNSIKLQKQCFEMLEDTDRKLKKDFTQKLKMSFFGGRAAARKGCILTVRAHGDWEHN